MYNLGKLNVIIFISGEMRAWEKWDLERERESLMGGKFYKELKLEGGGHGEVHGWRQNLKSYERRVMIFV